MNQKENRILLIQGFILIITIAFVLGLLGGFCYNIVEFSHTQENDYKTSAAAALKDWDYCFSPIPELLLTRYYNDEDQGTIHFEDSYKFNGYSWSCGYYKPDTEDIHIRVDVDDARDTLCHEMGHYLYYNHFEDYEKWDQLAADHYQDSIYYCINGVDGQPYFQGGELFAQEIALYMQAHPNPGYHADPDKKVMWIFERTTNPYIADYIENIMEEYYN